MHRALYAIIALLLIVILLMAILGQQSIYIDWRPIIGFIVAFWNLIASILLILLLVLIYLVLVEIRNKLP